MKTIIGLLALYAQCFLAAWAYSFQTFSVGQVLTSSQMNQVEVNIRDHIHGASSVSQLVATVTRGNEIMADGTTWQSVANSNSGFRNRIINGDQRIDQRNVGATQTFTAGAAVAYNVDRWYGSCTGANVTGTRTTGTNGEFSYQYTGAASVTQILHGTRIESHDIWDLTSTTATLSVTLSNALLTTVTWTAYYANAKDDWSAKTQIATGSWTITDSAVRYAAQIALGANAKNGVAIEFTVGAQTSGAYRIEDVQLEAGSIATAFERREYEEELARCQRYYQKSFQQTVAPAQNVGGSGAGALEFVQAVAASTAQPGGSLCRFAVPMRASPTITFYNWNAANAQAVNRTTAGDCTGTATIGTGDASFGVQVTTPGGTAVGQGLSVHWTAAIEL